MQIEPLCLWIALQHNAHIHLLCVRSNRDRRGNHKPFQSIPILFLAKKFQSTRPIRGATIKEISCHDCFREFQSTRPMRGATRGPGFAGGVPSDFNPRAPCGARLKINIMLAVAQDISIHAPHAGRDLAGSSVPPRVHHFNPRAPCGARLQALIGTVPAGFISIHAPHTGRDGENGAGHAAGHGFQSTRPIRGATKPETQVPAPM